jgi:hypothetical protein
LSYTLITSMRHLSLLRRYHDNKCDRRKSA